MEDQSGQLWLVTGWHGPDSATEHRAERRMMHRAEAAATVARFCIPEAFHADFRECLPTDTRLEDAIQEARALLFLIAGQADIHAGLAAMLARVGKELADAFYSRT